MLTTLHLFDYSYKYLEHKPVGDVSNGFVLLNIQKKGFDAYINLFVLCSTESVVDPSFLTFMQVKRLPVGDGIWIARHRKFLTEYVLDFIVERKNVADLGSSIRDNRYKDQKSRLQVLSKLP